MDDGEKVVVFDGEMIVLPVDGELQNVVVTIDGEVISGNIFDGEIVDGEVITIPIDGENVSVDGE